MSHNAQVELRASNKSERSEQSIAPTSAAAHVMAQRRCCQTCGLRCPWMTAMTEMWRATDLIGERAAETRSMRVVPLKG